MTEKIVSGDVGSLDSILKSGEVVLPEPPDFAAIRARAAAVLTVNRDALLARVSKLPAIPPRDQASLDMLARRISDLGGAK
jgi:hypothetical protein